eukprot:RCo013417
MPPPSSKRSSRPVPVLEAPSPGSVDTALEGVPTTLHLPHADEDPVEFIVRSAAVALEDPRLVLSGPVLHRTSVWLTRAVEALQQRLVQKYPTVEFEEVGVQVEPELFQTVVVPSPETPREGAPPSSGDSDDSVPMGLSRSTSASAASTVESSPSFTPEMPSPPSPPSQTT